MTHGWPGSVLEFRDAIGLLRSPAAHGGDARQAFHLVILYLPGFGFSDKLVGLGWNMNRIADAWVELMRRLEYKRWAAQGGDWGAAISTTLGYKAPSEFVGIHPNMVLFQPTEQERENATTEGREMMASAHR